MGTDRAEAESGVGLQCRVEDVLIIENTQPPPQTLKIPQKTVHILQNST